MSRDLNSVNDDMSLRGKPQGAEPVSIVNDGESLINEPVEKPSPDLRSSDNFSDRYQIQSVIGQGGMGEVLLAIHMGMKRKVAIKRIKGQSNPTSLRRFLTEAESLAKLTHKNIVTVHDSGHDEQGPYIVMEYVEGGTVSDRLKTGAMPVDESIRIISQVCEGLGQAHTAGIIHRDIKPGNILLTSDGVPKLADFGLARAEGLDAGHTVAGAVLGTIDFMPPEQRRDVSLTDARSDLWSLAATFYQMITGKSPRIIRFDLVPKEMHGFLQKALEESKENRFQDAASFIAGLKVKIKIDIKGNLKSVSKDFIEGLCVICHIENDVKRKFCKQCAAPLRVGCLKCNGRVSVWDKVCGECGCKQSDLLILIQKKFDERITNSKKLSHNYKFDRAIASLQEIINSDDPRLADRKGFAVELVDNIRCEEKNKTDWVTAQLSEAKDHISEQNYQAAIELLESVPLILQTPQVKQSLGLAKSCHAELSELLNRINHRSETCEYEGLLHLVEIADKLTGGKQEDLKTLRDRLILWETGQKQIAFDNKLKKAELLSSQFCFVPAIKIVEDLINENDNSLADRKKTAMNFADEVRAAKKIKEDWNNARLEQAEECIANFDYDTAIQLLDSIPPVMQTVRAGHAMALAKSKRYELSELLKLIHKKKDKADYEGLLQDLVRADELAGEKLVELESLRQLLITWEFERDSETKIAFSLAEEYSSNHKYLEAWDVIKVISMTHLSHAQIRFRSNIMNIANAESHLKAKIKSAKAGGMICPFEAIELLYYSNNYLNLNPYHKSVQKLKNDLSNQLSGFSLETWEGVAKEISILDPDHDLKNFASKMRKEWVQSNSKVSMQSEQTLDANPQENLVFFVWLQEQLPRLVFATGIIFGLLERGFGGKKAPNEFVWIVFSLTVGGLCYIPCKISLEFFKRISRINIILYGYTCVYLFGIISFIFLLLSGESFYDSFAFFGGSLVAFPCIVCFIYLPRLIIKRLVRFLHEL
jgi:serine/threonine protein kinase